MFGEHKTLRGFVVMIPAAAVSFVALAAAVGDPAAAGLWPLTPLGYAGLGAFAGFGFMAGELPNSFIKRQLGIRPGDCPPGAAPRQRRSLSPIGSIPGSACCSRPARS